MRPDALKVWLFQIGFLEFRSPAMMVSMSEFSMASRSAVSRGGFGLLYTATNLNSLFPRLMWMAVLVIEVVGMLMEWFTIRLFMSTAVSADGW